ncbi:conserved hypothetical protein [Paraburkholderia ribeironis]|uniref:PAAR repeat-containing protein n=1 Tax=Paraburkholderia ribeironis TaxID=1247936 RepID=A0A1N7RRK5_9BURK|nr:hypothetical protein [Paraburkholderia ribeironis]SIT37738.1 conserved hypothetical protein [Paraburkholderia ribeironis]
MGLFYAAVDGDPLTSHEDSHVIAREGHRAATVKGDDGKIRSVVYIGDSAWCGACQSTGVIVGGAGISENRRMIDLAGGARRQAVGGDEIHCNCSTPPRVIAIHGTRWSITDDARREATSPQKPAPPPALPVEPKHARWFAIVDSTTGEPLHDREFIANVDGARQSGRTDSNGYAQIATDGEKPIDIHIVFSSPRRKLNASGS